MKKGTKTLIILLAVLVVILGGGYFLYSAAGSGRLAALPALRALRALKLPPRNGPPGSSGGKAAGQAAQAEEKFAAPVAVYTARTGNARDTLRLYGSVFAQTEVSIFTTVSGKASEIRVREGDAVHKSQVLALIDRDQAGLKYAPVEVTSTIDGTVKSVLVELGGTANPGVPLFQIVNMDTVEIEVSVPEKRIAEVRPGLPAEIAVVSYPQRVFHGAVSRLRPVVDPASRTLEVRIRVPNAGYLLRPGMFAEARIVLRSREGAVLVPMAGFVDKQGRQAVFVVHDGTVRQVEPRIAFFDGEQAVIDSGVAAGDRIVVIGQQNLSDGDPVSVVEEKQ
jgi:membrane fusion protein (multidrug efflux system)